MLPFCPRLVSSSRMKMISMSSPDERLLRLLGGTDLFKGLAPKDLAVCAARFRQARFDKGQLLFARGDPGTHLYLVAEGQVRLAIGTSEGRELSFQIAVAGDLFG